MALGARGCAARAWIRWALPGSSLGEPPRIGEHGWRGPRTAAIFKGSCVRAHMRARAYALSACGCGCVCVWGWGCPCGCGTPARGCHAPRQCTVDPPANHDLVAFCLPFACAPGGWPCYGHVRTAGVDSKRGLRGCCVCAGGREGSVGNGRMAAHTAGPHVWW